MLEYLKKLEQELASLEPSKRKDILRHYEERFHHERIYEGKSDEEIVKELGDPKDVAAKILRESGHASHETEQETVREPQIWRAFWLVLFDVFVVVWLVPFLFGLFVSLMGTIGSMLLSLLDAQIIGLEGLVSVLFILGVGYLLFLLALWVVDVLLAFVHWLIKSHAYAFGVASPKQLLHTLRAIRPQSFFLRRPVLSTLKGTLAVVGVFMIAASLVLAFVGVGGFNFQPFVREHIDQTETREVTTEEAWNLTLESDIGAITFHESTDDFFRVDSYAPDDTNFEVFFNDDEGSIHVKHTLDRQWFPISINFGFFTPQSSLDIYVPENVRLDEVSVSSINGSVRIPNFSFETLEVSTVNGSVVLDDVQMQNSIVLQTTNGRIELNAVNAESYELQTTNGSVNLRDLNSPDNPGGLIDVRTVNGSISMRNVYVSDVDLRTTNGSISYTNDDKSFVVNRLRTRSTHGSITVDVDEKE